MNLDAFEWGGDEDETEIENVTAVWWMLSEDYCIYERS